MNPEQRSMLDQRIINTQLKREDFWNSFRNYLAVNNIDKSEYDLKITFDGLDAVHFNCDGCKRDMVMWQHDETFEIREPKNKEVRYWETSDINEAFDIMMERSTPEKYKRLL